MKDSSYSNKSVSEQFFNQQVDALVKDPHSEKVYSNLWTMLKQIMKHGLDYRSGNPIKGISRHIRQVCDQLQASRCSHLRSK